MKQGTLIVGSTLLAPALSKLPTLAGYSDQELAAAAALVHGGATQAFVLEAQAIPFLMLLSAAAAIVEILQYFGIKPYFGPSVSYEASPSCRYQFQDYHAEWRRNGYQAFAGVSRCPADGQMMVVCAADSQMPASMSRAEMAGLYSGFGVVHLAEQEPGVVRAGVELAKQECRLSEREIASIASITSKTDIHVPGSVEQIPVKCFRNAQGGFILHQMDNTGASPGKVAVHVPGQTNFGAPLIRSLSLKA
jgi:hypothetical protein